MRQICVDEQFFPKIREKGGIYVDKTEAIYNCFKDGTYFFISRPRRFGKSTLCSTIAALFAGKRELFKGLWIEQSAWKWDTHPVIHLDMTAASSPEGNMQRVVEGLFVMFSGIVKDYGIDPITQTAPANYLGVLIKALYEKTGKQVVVIVDEYDKPLLDVIHHKDRYPAAHDFLRDLYSQLKKNSEYLRFVLLTGVFKFGKTSVFSGLNNLTDLTFDPGAAQLLGYTEQEIIDNFPEHLDALAKAHGKTVSDMIEVLREKYNGYAFGVDKKESVVVGSVYNPFAINHVLHAQQLIDRWFVSATPTFLIQKLKEHAFVGIDPSELTVSFGVLDGSSGPDNIESLFLLYYAGYVTLRAYNNRYGSVTLDFPNAEVSRALADCLLPAISGRSLTSFGVITRKITDMFYDEDLAGLKDAINAALAMVPYHLFGTQESYYQTIIYLLFNASSVITLAEDMSSCGRADITVLLPHVIYIFELKMNQPAAVALEQIKQRGYAEKYKHLGRKIYLVGVELSSGDRVVKDIVVEALM